MCPCGLDYVAYTDIIIIFPVHIVCNDLYATRTDLLYN